MAEASSSSADERARERRPSHMGLPLRLAILQLGRQEIIFTGLFDDQNLEQEDQRSQGSRWFCCFDPK